MRSESISLDIRARAHRCGSDVNEMVALRFPSCKNTKHKTRFFFQFVEHIVIVGRLLDSQVSV